LIIQVQSSEYRYWYRVEKISYKVENTGTELRIHSQSLE
jgi:hypothetical protein